MHSHRVQITFEGWQCLLPPPLRWGLFQFLITLQADDCAVIVLYNLGFTDFKVCPRRAEFRSRMNNACWGLTTRLAV